MPSSPKFFNARPHSSFSTPRATLLALAICLLVGISGFIVGIVSVFGPTPNCSRSPRSVRVVWDKSGGGSGVGGEGDGNRKRLKVMGFVGIFTGFGSVGRRQSLRQTWMPSDQQGLQREDEEEQGERARPTGEQRDCPKWSFNIVDLLEPLTGDSLEEATGLAIRFMIGRTTDNSKMSELRKEVAEYDDFVLLDIEEEYNKLPYKTLAFFKVAYALYDAEFYVKADDDIYLRPDRLSLLLAKDRSHSQIYLGCMKKGPVFTDPKLKWYEPLSYMLGKEYFLHAYGPIYALSADVVASLVALRNNSFRMFSNEDVTIGAWMLAMNVNQENNQALCEPECTSSSIAVWDIPKCSGLCNPEKRLLELHQMESCSKSPTMESDD